MTETFDTPILFLIFNRPDTTQNVFDAIKMVKPKSLYVAADGYRESRPNEKELCIQTRDIIKGIDWECEVKTLFRDKNLGCKVAVSEAISWFFDNVNEGIIIEDDCLPNKSFFYFCQTLLEKYRNDDRVMQIGGVNFQDGNKRSDGSYFFCRKNHIWGWATWKRSWQKYDVKISNYPKFKESNQLKYIFKNERMNEILYKKFDEVYENRIDTWDIQWEYTILSNNGLVILPEVNLVSNIGFRADATHTTGFDKNVANKPTFPLDEIVHPTFMIANSDADDYIFDKEHPKERTITKILRKTKNLIKKVIFLGKR